MLSPEAITQPSHSWLRWLVPVSSGAPVMPSGIRGLCAAVMAAVFTEALSSLRRARPTTTRQPLPLSVGATRLTNRSVSCRSTGRSYRLRLLMPSTKVR